MLASYYKHGWLRLRINKADICQSRFDFLSVKLTSLHTAGHIGVLICSEQGGMRSLNTFSYSHDFDLVRMTISQIVLISWTLYTHLIIIQFRMFYHFQRVHLILSAVMKTAYPRCILTECGSCCIQIYKSKQNTHPCHHKKMYGIIYSLSSIASLQLLNVTFIQ